jgi:Tn3 transposase DDE domain-containing protein
VYVALRELGRAIRTGFLLQYLSDAALRRLILRSLNMSELFNGFLRWVFFGGKGIITENRRDEQRKIIKYNHLVANLVIFHNVVMMTKVLRQLLAEGHSISAEAVAILSPYPTAHINRLGVYSLQFDQEPEPIDYDLPLAVIRHPSPLTFASL